MSTGPKTERPRGAAAVWITAAAVCGVGLSVWLLSRSSQHDDGAGSGHPTSPQLPYEAAEPEPRQANGTSPADPSLPADQHPEAATHVALKTIPQAGTGGVQVEPRAALAQAHAFQSGRGQMAVAMALSPAMGAVRECDQARRKAQPDGPREMELEL